MESLVAADNPEGAESVGQVAMSEQAVEQDQSADDPGPSGIPAPGFSEQPRPEEGEPLKKKKRKLNKLKRVEKSMQKMIDSFLASEEKGRRKFIELEKKKMEMENEAARNAAIREERFLQVMQQTILMARQPTPAPSLAQPQPNSGMYHFDLLLKNPSTTASSSFPHGTVINLGASFSTIALQTSRTVTQAVEMPTPNRWLIVRNSTFVPSLHSVTATLCSTDNGCLVTILLSKDGLSLLHSTLNVSLLTLKFCFHSSSLQPLTTLSKNA